MSKITAYREAKARAEKVRRYLTQALGKDSPNNDKHALYTAFIQMERDGWDEFAILSVHASYGYYGSSSSYCAMDEDVARYLTRAINKLMPQIAELAMELADQDVEKARREAEEEAREVLREISTV